MSALDFYYMPESPFCRSVELTAGMAGVNLSKHYINLFISEHLNEEYTRINPLQKVPFIIDGGLRIGESRAIMAYLVDRYMPKDNTLYPKDPAKRARVDEVLYIDCGLLFPIISKLFKPRMFGLAKELNYEDEISLRKIFNYLENRLRSNGDLEFFLFNYITLGDIALSVTLSMLIANDYNFSEFKLLNSYYIRLTDRIPNFAAINDKPIENMRNFIKSNQYSL